MPSPSLMLSNDVIAGCAEETRVFWQVRQDTQGRHQPKHGLRRQSDTGGLQETEERQCGLQVETVII